MSYVKDENLEFLSRCTSEDLSIIFDILTKDKDGKERYSEKLTTNEKVIANKPNHAAYWDLIAGELQHYGGNTIFNLVRGNGVQYKEILTNVCDKLKVNYNSKATIETIELNLLMKILTDSMEKMTPEELKILVDELNLNTPDLSKPAILAAIQAGIKLSGFMVYRVSLIIANAVARAILGRGLALAANAGLMRVIGMIAGPIGWAITAIWTIFDVAGPAYRVSIPVVIQIAYLRAKITYGKE